MLHDFRLALRTYARRPMFALLIVMLLAIGVGANTFVLGLVETVLWRPFAFRDQDRLAMLWLRDRTRNVSFVEMSYPDFLDIRERNRTFADLAAMPAVNSTYNLTGEGEPQVITGRPVTGSFFEVLGVRPAIGRSFEPSEGVKGGATAAVLSDGFWRRQFGGDPAIVGRSLRLDGNPVTVVGVMPPVLTIQPASISGLRSSPASKALRRIGEPAGCWQSGGLHPTRHFVRRPMR